MNKDTLKLVQAVVETRQAYIQQPEENLLPFAAAVDALDSVETWVDAEPDTADGLQAIYEVQVASARNSRLDGALGSRSGFAIALDDLAAWFWRYVKHNPME